MASKGNFYDMPFFLYHQNEKVSFALKCFFNSRDWDRAPAEIRQIFIYMSKMRVILHIESTQRCSIIHNRPVAAENDVKTLHSYAHHHLQLVDVTGPQQAHSLGC